MLVPHPATSFYSSKTVLFSATIPPAKVVTQDRERERELTLTAAASYDVLQERVLGGYQAPAPAWHPFSLEWSRILVAAVAIRTSASLRLGRSRAGRDTLRRSCAYPALHSGLSPANTTVATRRTAHLAHSESSATSRSTRLIRAVARRARDRCAETMRFSRVDNERLPGGREALSVWLK